MQTEEITKTIKEKLTDLGADKYCINILLEHGFEVEVKDILKTESHNKVAYIAYTAVDGNTYITAHDMRSWSEVWKTKTVRVFPSILESMLLKEAFFATLEMGGIKDRLFAVINNPDDRTANEGLQSNLKKILNLSEKIDFPDGILNNTVAEIESHRGVTLVKSISDYDPSFGDVYFMKGDVIKSIPLIGDRHISLEYLMYKEELILELLEGAEEPIHIQKLAYVLRDIQGPIKVRKDEATTIRFTSFFGDDSFYNVGDDYIITYDKKRGIRQKRVYKPGYINPNEYKKAYNLLETIECEDVKGKYKGFALDDKGRFERSYTNDEED